MSKKLLRAASLLLLALGTAVAGLTVAPAPVRADPEPEVSTDPAEDQAAAPPDLWSRFLAVEVSGAVDGPFGVFGGAVVITPVRYLSLDAGGGVSRDGGRVAGGARLVLPHANAAFGVRVGFAGGPLTWDSPVAAPGNEIPEEVATRSATERRTWDFVGFLDVSVSLEVRFDFGMYTRFDFGIEHALAGPSSCVHTDSAGSTACSVGSFEPTRTWVSLALGYAFDM